MPFGKGSLLEVQHVNLNTESNYVTHVEYCRQITNRAFSLTCTSDTESDVQTFCLQYMKQISERVNTAEERSSIKTV